jgi:copper chaperone CopZ
MLLTKNKYAVTGMTCEACEYKVKYILSQLSDIQNIEVDWKAGEISFDSEEDVTFGQLLEVFKPHEKYKILKESSPIIQTNDTPKTWTETYYPLLLIAGFITGVALLTSFHLGIYEWKHFQTKMFLHNFMTGFFLVFSFFKLLNIKDFANSFAMYDLLAMRVPAYGKIYPFLELGLGVLCLIHFQPKMVYVADIALMGFGNLGVISSVLNKKQIKCACLGAVFNLPMSTVTIIENTLMILVGVVLLFVF